MQEIQLIITLATLLTIYLLYSQTRKNSTKQTEQNQSLQEKLNTLEKDIERLERLYREETNSNQSLLRQEITGNIKVMTDLITKNMGEIAYLLKNQLETNTTHIDKLTEATLKQTEKITQTIENKLIYLQQQNDKKLEEIRLTVDEKLHTTLEKRLGESFKQVSERLELLHKGLGEMQQLASNVGDLKKILTNVKTRGVWGEIQLTNILEQILTPEQYLKNVETKKGSNEKVEIAIKLPGDGNQGEVLLPIDAKFPQEDYQRLLEAYEQGDQQKILVIQKQLKNTIKSQANKIQSKYLDPPNTTDFAIMFLPTESLYAEILRIPGLSEEIQIQNRVVITGPTTLAAFLNSLQIGFRTIAIQKRTTEIWKILGAVKTEFNKFTEIIEKANEKIISASKQLEAATKKTRTIEKKLKDVESLPQDVAEKMLE